MEPEQIRPHRAEERGRRLAQWDATDAYWSGGQKLVPCGASLSPGCQAGGTHFAEIENFLRIVQNVDDTWSVTSKDGTESTYSLIGATGPTKFRWGLTARTGVLGNSVAYTWDCAGANDHCYPESVPYNGALIEFHRESRPDPVSSPVDVVMRQRLKTIDVTLSGNRVRAYKLTYAASAQSARSLLANVQMYGTDAVLDGSGTGDGRNVASPDELHLLERRAGERLRLARHLVHRGLRAPGTFHGTADFDGDGLTDQYCHFGGWNGLKTEIRYSDGTSFDAGQVVLSNWCDAASDVFTTGDFDGDGFLRLRLLLSRANQTGLPIAELHRTQSSPLFSASRAR